MITVDDLPADPEYAPVVTQEEFTELLKDPRVEGYAEENPLPTVVRGKVVRLYRIAVRGKEKNVYVYRRLR